ncbi:MAG: hypothetical protein LBE10_07500 [Treponema sp.]|jgi:uncharacterized protein (DUF608 family)|nr:hypothetical protein [Treponema sp.]
MIQPRVYSNDHVFAAFPLGGIGTGTISLGSRGDLRDFEIFNRPGKGCKLPFSFFAIRCETEAGIDARVLESQIQPDFNQGRGYHPNRVTGLPHFGKSSLSVAYPLAELHFEDVTFPLEVSLTAFTPFIPLNADDSGIPAAVFRYRVKNPSGKPAKVTLAATMPNISGFRGFDCFENYKAPQGCFNTFRKEGGIRGIFMDGGVPKTALNYANNAIITGEKDVSVKQEWRKTGWWDGIYDFWDDFRNNGRLHDGEQGIQENKVAPPGAIAGSLAVHKEIGPGTEADFEFVISWYVPNRVKGWPPYENDEAEPRIKNYYAVKFSDAWDAGFYLLSNLERLESLSGEFSRAVYGSTLPEPVIDAAMSNITALRSTTCFRIEDGSFLAWEGSHEHEGSCRGTCTHVWNYAQTVAFLFPELEKSARCNEFIRETDDTGKMNFRTDRIFGRSEWDMLAAADGQLGTIVRVYREWSLTGDDAFLKRLWPKIKKAFEYVRIEWDRDGDELLEGRQHNTYDIEFFGVNPLTGVMYLAALAAMEKMAAAMGEAGLASQYRERREISAARLDEKTWNGEYFIQPAEHIDEHPYQFGKGCLSDQLLGQTLAYISGLGPLLPEAHLKKAAASIFKYNFKSGAERDACLQRLYVADDEAGLVLASWPNGGKPRLPFVYADEVWTGVEYQAATFLIYEGLIDEALTIVRTIRNRQDGFRRNPWDEVECGFHYARSLASWGLIPALSGASYDAAADRESFEPRINQDDFHCFFSNGKYWGMLHQTREAGGTISQKLEVLGDKK